MQETLKEDEKSKIIAFNQEDFYLMVNYGGNFVTIGYGNANECDIAQNWQQQNEERRFKRVFQGNSYEESVNAMWEHREEGKSC